ncbi:hypothetical protein PRIPAC_93606, partial [Pristionchus pacificus]|uniref:Uncharacterized protein n=1 Tax=Pristionchus pacificus TaxID=54126 RepID=A0A2A6CQM8_PRIPA
MVSTNHSAMINSNNLLPPEMWLKMDRSYFETLFHSHSPIYHSLYSDVPSLVSMITAVDLADFILLSTQWQIRSSDISLLIVKSGSQPRRMGNRVNPRLTPFNTFRD